MEDFDEKFLRKSESFNLKKFLKYDVKLQELSKLSSSILLCFLDTKLQNRPTNFPRSHKFQFRCRISYICKGFYKKGDK